MFKEPKSGICKLTGREGRFVKSHLISEALTETYWRGQPLTQMGQHGRPIKRWTSWYDPALVTAHGEAILTRYDTWAIEFFRQQKMIWSSWGDMEELDTKDHIWSACSTRGLRQIQNVDSKMLRLFFLSLLWRAAATSLFKFEAVDLPAIDIEHLRTMLVDETDTPQEFYPISLVQLSTRNMPHNMAPLVFLAKNQ